MPEVAIWTENVVIPADSARIVLKGERLDYPPEYFVQHLSAGLMVQNRTLLSIIAVLQ
jgi:hypothetical protein